MGFSPNPLESILNEAGRVENYRQPYVDQWLLSAEKTFGPRWKAEISYLNRVNRDIVGLVLRGSLALVVVAVALGGPLAYMAGRALRSQLFGVSATDPMLLLLALSSLVAVALDVLS